MIKKIRALKNKYRYATSNKTSSWWEVKNFKLSNNSIEIEGKLYSNRVIHEANLHFAKFRDDQYTFEAPLEITPILKSVSLFKYIGAPIYLYNFKCRLELTWSEIPASLYNLYIKTDIGGTKTRQRGPQDLILHPDENTTLLIGYDPIAKSFRAEKLDFGKDALERISASNRNPSEVICIMGEYPFCARDNCFALYNSLQPDGHAYQSDIKAFYAIEKDNQENLETKGNILAWGSIEHIQKCVDANIVIVSHDARNSYPRIASKIRGNTPPSIFVGHGVTGLKGGMHRFYNKKRTNHSKIIATSEIEASIFKKHFGYAENDIKVTGLPRHDYLLKKAEGITSDPNRVLVFPTWRDDFLVKGFDFQNSDYVINWSKAITSLTAKGLKVTLIIHPMAIATKPYLEIHANEIMSASEFQKALIKSSAVLTDYSSICYEAILLSKPVFFLHFDRSAYSVSRRPYITLDKELMGPASQSPTAIADIIAAWAKRNWTDDHDYPAALTYKDQLSCSRITNVIRETLS